MCFFATGYPQKKKKISTRFTQKYKQDNYLKKNNKNKILPKKGVPYNNHYHININIIIVVV